MKSPRKRSAREAFRPDIAWLLAAGLLLAHQVLQYGFAVRLPLLDNYLDPLLSVPVLIGLLYVERRYLFGSETQNTRLHAGFLVGLTAGIALIGEEVFPRIAPLTQTRDAWDYVAYSAGGLITFLYLNKDR